MEQENNTTQNKNKLLMLVVPIVVILLAVAAYFVYASMNQPASTQETASMQEESMEGDAMMEQEGNEVMEESMEEDKGVMGMESDEVKTFTITAGNFYFEPNTLTVNEGDKVKIVLSNTEGTHDWNLDEFNAQTTITQTGDTVEIEFVADQAGSFEYYCSVGSHRAMGMVGTLVVQ